MGKRLNASRHDGAAGDQRRRIIGGTMWFTRVRRRGTKGAKWFPPR